MLPLSDLLIGKKWIGAQLCPISRFGFVVGIVALQNVSKDEEIFVYYGYQVERPEFKWYFDLKERFDNGLE